MSGWRLWIIAFLLVLVPGQLAVGMRASTTATVTGDEPFYLLTAQSLVSDGDLDLRDEYADRDVEMARFWDGTKPLWKQMEPAPDGRLLSPHDPGLSLLISPAYALGGLEGVRRFLVVVWAAAMALAALLARRAGAPDWAALLAAVAVGAGTPGLVYASQVYPESPAALCIAAALAFALPFRSPEGPPQRCFDGLKGNLNAIGLVGSLIALEWLGVKYLPYALLIAGLWAWNNRAHRTRLAVAAAVSTAAALHFTWWHLETFGGLTPYSTNVVWAGEGTRSILTDHLTIGDRTYRLYGLYLDARFGLIRWLPIAPLAIWGATRTTRTHLATLAIATALGTFVSITIMGYWFPGRMLIAALPSLATMIALGATKLPKTAVALATWSAAIAGAVAIAAKNRTIRLAVDPWTLNFPLPPAALFPDFRQFGTEEVLKSAAWAAALAAALIWTNNRAGTGWRVARRKGPAKGGTHEVGGSPLKGRILRDRTRHPAEAGARAGAETPTAP